MIILQVKKKISLLFSFSQKSRTFEEIQKTLVQMPEKIILTPKYYLDYFHFLLHFVEKKYAHILNKAENSFLSSFAQLTEDEQCLYVRFSNRRASFFRTDKLKYAEIEDIPAIICSLIDKGFIEEINAQHLILAGELLDIFNKAELMEMAKMLQLDTKGKTSLKKEDVLDWLMTVANFEEIITLLQVNPQDVPSVIKVGYDTEVQLIKFLFFGTRHGDMTEFVVRDLGFQTYQHFDEDNLVPHFETRQEAEDKLKVSLAREDFYLMQTAKIAADEIYHWFMDWADQHHKSLAEIAVPTFERFALKVGMFLEKQKAFDEALSILKLTSEHPSRERQVRILHKTNNLEEAKALCEQMLAEPQNADEQFFAIDFFNKLDAQLQKKRVKKSVTQELHNAESISLSIDWKRQVELGVIHYYEERHQKATFTENHLWRSLFGLLFWDIIFDTESMAMHHPLQRSPSDLYKPVFFDKRKAKMEERLLLLEDEEVIRAYLYDTFFAKYGITNPLVEWYGGLFPLVITLVEKLSAEQLRKVLLEIARDLRENLRGFPDLLVWDDGDYCFVEVKSPTDNLSNQQLYWLRFFAEQGIKSKVLRVEWKKAILFEEE